MTGDVDVRPYAVDCTHADVAPPERTERICTMMLSYWVRLMPGTYMYVAEPDTAPASSHALSHCVPSGLEMGDKIKGCAGIRVFNAVNMYLTSILPPLLTYTSSGGVQLTSRRGTVVPSLNTCT